MLDGAHVVRVENRAHARGSRLADGGWFSGSTGHDQLMIRLKNDEPCLVTDDDEGVQNYYHCGTCQRGGHVCGYCSSPVTHMAQGWCIECTIKDHETWET